MTGIWKGAVSSLVAAGLVGILGYVFVVRENQLLIRSLQDDVAGLKKVLDGQRTEIVGKIDATTDRLHRTQIFVAQAHPGKPFVGVNARGEEFVARISPFSTAVIQAAGGLAEQIDSADQGDSEELGQMLTQFRKLVELAQSESPSTNEELETFFSTESSNRAMDNPATLNPEHVKIHAVLENKPEGGANAEVLAAMQALDETFRW